MSSEYDVVIRGGTVMDGNGGTPFIADVAVKDGKIAAVGTIAGSGAEEIDARGLSVTPGFVDIHTHYDGQAMWDSHLAPSSWHGVTTVVMGNCGVGFAPVRKDTQDKVVALMEGVEDLPGPCLNEGLDWTWESFGEYLTALERRKHDIDFCALLPHAPMRVFVMGDRAMALEDANQEDVARMREITAEAVRAGAFGFSTSRTIAHKTLAGDHHPGLRAQENELMGIAMGLKDAGAGFIEMTSDWNTPDPGTEFAMVRRIMRASGRPLVFSLNQRHDRTEAWKDLLALSTQAAADGLPIRCVAPPRPIGALLGLTSTFLICPIRNARSVAWFSTAGFHHLSKWMTWDAAVRLSPAPPALTESTKKGTFSSSWNWRTRSLRCLTSVEPCRTRPGCPNTEQRNAASGPVVSLNCVKTSAFSCRAATTSAMSRRRASLPLSSSAHAPSPSQCEG